jgi:hypothetical protein
LEKELETAAVARKGGLGRAEMVACVNAVEFAVETGAWARADELLAELKSRPTLPERMADSVRLDVALLAAYRGDSALAHASLDELGRLPEGEDRSIRAWYGRVRAVVHLTSGELVAAYDEAVAAVEVEPLGGNSGVAAWCAARAALWLRDVTRAEVALEAMPQDDRRWATAARRAVEAGVAALRGDVAEAASTYDTLLPARLAVGDPFTHALMTLDAVAVLPEELLPEGAVETARTYLEGLGAHGLLVRFARAGIPA